jgi:uncharacterized membrane protein
VPPGVFAAQLLHPLNVQPVEVFRRPTSLASARPRHCSGRIDPIQSDLIQSWRITSPQRAIRQRCLLLDAVTVAIIVIYRSNRVLIASRVRAGRQGLCVSRLCSFCWSSMAKDFLTSTPFGAIIAGIFAVLTACATVLGLYLTHSSTAKREEHAHERHIVREAGHEKLKKALELIDKQLEKLHGPIMVSSRWR